MTGNVLKEIKENIKDYEEQGIKQIPISLVKYWISILKQSEEINCRNCEYFVSDSVSSDCLKRKDIGYNGVCIDGMDLHKLAKECPYYD